MEKSMKTMEKSIKTMEHSMKTTEKLIQIWEKSMDRANEKFSCKIQQITCFCSKM